MFYAIGFVKITPSCKLCCNCLFLTHIIWLDPQRAKRKIDKYCFLDLMISKVLSYLISLSKNSNSCLLITNKFELFLTVLFEAKVNQKLSLNGMIDGYRFIYMITRGYTYVRVRSRCEILVNWRKSFDTDYQKFHQ